MLSNDVATGGTSAKFRKRVAKDSSITLQEPLYVHCKHTGQYQGLNSYIVAIAASYPNKDATYLEDFYLAKFNTQYNLTENVVTSQDSSVSERVVGVEVDLNNELIFLATSVNKN